VHRQINKQRNTKKITSNKHLNIHINNQTNKTKKKIQGKALTNLEHHHCNIRSRIQKHLTPTQRQEGRTTNKIWNENLMSKRISTPHRQTPHFIKSCKKIVQIMLLSSIMVHFALVILTPLKVFSAMDLEIDYYSSKCKDINGLWVFKGTFMTFGGGDNDH
jgi:hypothetical protein